MDKKKHTLSLSAVWNQIDQSRNSVNDTEQSTKSIGTREIRNATSERNSIFLNHSSSRNNESKLLAGRPSSVRPKSTLPSNANANFEKHYVVKNQGHKNVTGNTFQKRRSYNTQHHKSAGSIVDGNYIKNKNVHTAVSQDNHNFSLNSRRNMQKDVRDRRHFHDIRTSENHGEKGLEENERILADNFREAKPISFTTLKDLITKQPNEILLSINKKNCGFMILLKQENIRPDMMAYVLISLGKACTANLSQNVSSLVNTVSNNKNLLMNSVQMYLVSLRPYSVKDFNLQSMMYLTIFLQKLQQIIPSTSSETISVLLPLLRSTCEKFLKSHELYDNVIEKLKEIDEENELFLSEHTPQEIKKASYKEAMQLLQPPENFRSLSVLPTIDDIQSNTFLRPNIVEGKYSDVEHYLDVQFRLLREDYVRPLKDGLGDYLMLKKAGKSIKNCRDVRVYEDVHIVKQDFVNGGIVHIAQFPIAGFSKVKWEYSKRFLSGSLLCLSSDNFQTMLFASVAQRLPEQLKKGLLLIRFEDITDEVLNLTPLREFVVIETTAYFEAYRHNLKALQELNNDVLPLKRYIVDVENTVNSPDYLQPSTVYDMRPLLIPLGDKYIKHSTSCDGEVTIEYEYPADVSNVCRSVKILDDFSWPSASTLNLDDSQYLALKAAATKEFAIIQGPPGTGKTYIGLRIVQLLLHNIEKWFSKQRNSLPILVVCFTNHALDQFLEGLMQFTNKIVRIGGRGRSESVSKFQLSNLKRVAVNKKELPRYISASMWHKNHELKFLKSEIDRINKFIQKTTYSVLGENELRNVIPSFHYDSLKSILKHSSVLEYNLSDDGLLIHDWLGLRSRVGWFDTEEFEIKEQKPEIPAKIPISALDDTDDIDNESVGEADIEFIEAQRDIDSEEFADVSFDIDSPEKEEFILPDNFGWQVQGGRKRLLKFIKNCLHNSQPLEEKEAMRIRNVWELTVPIRWKLYKFWLEKFITDEKQKCFSCQTMLKTHFNEMCEMRTEGDFFILQNAHVVGMTTTGAAKYRDLVLRLNPQILIVEEAAEILESHIVTSLAPQTQHVILIGDHQQLRPSPTVHMLAVKYDLNISLFERMIKNKMDCFRLSTQHRMRPDIVDLIVPHIYTDLKNHEIVEKYENINGVTKNVFFITHNYSELSENDSKSKINEHEAAFMIKLCRYFVLQGYDPSQITVLTTYTGQLFTMKKLVTDVIRKVRFTVVDNFQGEENDIILISFVRSNEEGAIGFLKIANRVCVALSRAKKGLFCIGNFELLAEKSDLWKNITNTLKQKQAVGQSLQLICQNHPSVCNVVSTAKDFESVPEGGCTRICEYRLDCGHACSLMCHPYDRDHEKVRCRKTCNKTCARGHKCQKKCFEECGSCVQLVEKTIFPCGHTIMVRCHLQDSEIKCTAKCEKKLLCGHRCSNLCSESCAVVCKEKTTINSPICGHMVTIECRYKNRSEELIKNCRNPCDTILDCTHKCKGNCYHCLQGRLHVACNQPCKRILVCGHECKANCARSCPPCKLPCENKCNHSKCPKKCGEPCEICTEKCDWHCEHQKCARSCGEMCNRVPCNRPCLKALSCGHPCIGFCGEPCPLECRECDSEKVKEILFGTEDEQNSRFVLLEDCNHILEVSGLNEWMKVDREVDYEIQMKVCPKCKTVIRTNLRFGNTIKDCLRKIENVKKITFGNTDDNRRKQNKLLEDIKKEALTLKVIKPGSIYNAFNKILTARKCRSIQEITTLENTFRISLQLADVIRYLETSLKFVDQDSSVKEGLKVLTLFIESSKQSLVTFILDEYLTASEQQLHQLTWETHRLYLSKKLLKLVKERIVKSCDISNFKKCVSALIRYSAFGDGDVKLFTPAYESLAKSCGSAVINVSDFEKQSILKAMNLSVGHWYQCPNGHVYCISACGGAMEESRCNECHEKIGGTNHSLLSTNKVATDMDGARHAAWSETMNLGNYRVNLVEDQRLHEQYIPDDEPDSDYDDYYDVINSHDADFVYDSDF